MLKLQNINWTLENGTQIIKDINLDIPDGKLIVITGPNGGGKTTLAKIIAGIEKPTSGKIFLDNTDIKQKLRIDKIIRIVGLCDNGTTSINEQNNFYYKIKQISDYCNWTNIAPIFTDNVYLFDIQKFTKTFLSQISNIKLYNVRGNKYEIIQKLK